MMINFNVRLTFWTSKSRVEIIFRLLSIVYIFHIEIGTPDQLSATVPAIHLPCPLYLFFAPLRLVAEYLLCFPFPCLVFLGRVSINESPILNLIAIINNS